jgi:hypothetical protein
VRMEIAAALQRNMRVIPVLVQGASMPGTDELPEDLAPLTRRNAFELHDTGWSDDIRRLITVIERVIKGTSAATPDDPEVKRPSKKRIWLAPVGILMLVVIATLYGLNQIYKSPPPGFANGKLSDIDVDYGARFVYVNFKATIKGYPAGKKCEVRWTLFDDNTRAIVRDPKFQDQHATYITPRRYVDERAGKFKVPVPDRPGNYYVKLSLFPPDRPGESKALDVESSEGFDTG